MKKYIITLTLILLAGCGGHSRPSNTSKQEPQKKYVPEVIGGHLLPPMPDKKLNNATLKGIDSNNNGIRDDVEIFVLKQHYKPIRRELTLVEAKFHQAILTRPSSEAVEINAEQSKVSACSWYMYDTGLITGDEYSHGYDDEVKKTYNTIERIRKVSEYEKSLSGSVLEIPSKYMTKENCKKFGIDIDKLLKEKKWE